MKRFYYFARSLPSIQGIVRDLQAAGIGANRQHILGSDAGALARARVHAFTPWEQTDILHSGFVGTVVGATVGIISGFMLAGADPWGVSLGANAVLGATLFGACFGAWLGGLKGLSSDNPHLTPYLGRVAKGDYLMVIDADDAQQAARVEKVMRAHRDDAQEAGREEHYSPFG